MRETEILRGLHASRAKKAPKLDPRDNIPVMVAEGEAILPSNTVAALGGPESLSRLIEETNGQPPKRGLRAGHGYATGGVSDRLGNMWQGVKDKVGGGAGNRPTPNAVNAQTQSVSGPGQDAASVAQRVDGPKAPRTVLGTAKTAGGAALRNLGTVGSALTAGDDLGMVWSHPSANAAEKIAASAEALGNTAGGFLLDRVSDLPGLKNRPWLKNATAIAGPGSTVATGFRPVTALANLVSDKSSLQRLRGTHPALASDTTGAPVQQAQPPAQPKLNGAESGSIGTDPVAQPAAPAQPQIQRTNLEAPAAQSLAQAARDRRIMSKDLAPGTGFVVRTDSPNGGGTFINAPKPEVQAPKPMDLRDQLIDRMLNSGDKRTADRAQRALQALDNSTTQLEVAKLGRAATDTAAKRIEELIEGSSNQFVDSEGKPDLARNIELANFMRANMPTFTIDGKTLESSDLTAQQRQKLIADMRAAFLASKNADDAVNSQWIGAPGHSNERVILGDRLRKSSLGDIGVDGVGFAPLYDWLTPLTDDRVLNTSRGLVRAADYIGSGEGAADRRAEVAAIEQNSRRLGSYR